VSSFCEAKKTGHFLKPIGLENEHVESSDIETEQAVWPGGIFQGHFLAIWLN